MDQIAIEDINSAGIAFEARKAGITHVTRIGAGEAVEGNVNSRCTFYRLGSVRVADTNGDPVWEEQDPAAFAELAQACGVDL